MNKVEFDELLNKVLDHGIEITMTKNKENGLIWYNLNTEMKSQLEITFDGKKVICEGRYGHTGEITSYNDLLDEVENCKHGRDFANQLWIDVLENRYKEI